VKKRAGIASPGGARRSEFSEYIQGITSVWILHPVSLATLARYSAFDRPGSLAAIGGGPSPAPPVLLTWQVLACVASLWMWWDYRNPYARWLDRTTATGCAVGYMARSISSGGAVLSGSCVLLALLLTCFTLGWFVEDWFWCHVFFRYFIFWMSCLTMASGALPLSLLGIAATVLVTSFAMFGHIFLEQYLAEKRGLEFSLQKSYPQGMLRCGLAAVASGSFAWLAAL